MLIVKIICMCVDSTGGFAIGFTIILCIIAILAISATINDISLIVDINVGFDKKLSSSENTVIKN